MTAVIEIYIINYGSTWESHVILKDSQGRFSGESDTRWRVLKNGRNYREKGRGNSKERKQGLLQTGELV